MVINMSLFVRLATKALGLASWELQLQAVNRFPFLRKKMVWDAEMILDGRVPEQMAAIQCGHYELTCVEKCLSLVPDGGVFLDIGANIGFYTCAVAARWRKNNAPGVVHAFEPSFKNSQRLKENVAINGLTRQVTVNQLALGEKPGVLELYREPQGSTNNAVGQNMMSESDLAHVRKEGWQHESVTVSRLDDWAEKHQLQRCDLIKIDVEGAELLVFEGGKKLVEQFRPTILGEFSPYWMKQAGKTFADVMDFFNPFGYRYFREINGQFLPLTKETEAGLEDVPNYLLVPEARG